MDLHLWGKKKVMNKGRKSKFKVEIEESENGDFHLKSLKVDVDSVDQMELLTNQILPKVSIKLAQLNRELQGNLDRVSNTNIMEFFEYLKMIRLEISKREGVPAYVVFKDRTLKLMAEFRPRTKEEMLGLYGVGEKSFEKYGDRFIQAVAEYVEERSVTFRRTFSLSAESIAELEESLDLALKKLTSKIGSVHKKKTKRKSSHKIEE